MPGVGRRGLGRRAGLVMLALAVSGALVVQAGHGAGSAIVPQIIASQVATKPAAVTVWTDFRANQVDGDVYSAVSH